MTALMIIGGLLAGSAAALLEPSGKGRWIDWLWRAPLAGLAGLLIFGGLSIVVVG